MLPVCEQRTLLAWPASVPGFLPVWSSVWYALLSYSPQLTSNRKASATTTGRGCIGIADLKRLPDQILDKIDLRAADVRQGYRIDKNGCAVPLYDKVIGRAGGVEFERILKSRAPAAGNAYSERGSGRLRVENFANSPGGSLGNAHFGGDRIHFVLFEPCRM